MAESFYGEARTEGGGLPKGWKLISFSDAVRLNPKVNLTVGKEYSFIDMKLIEPERCQVSHGEARPFSGSGSRFLPGDTLMARITPCLENGKIARYMPDKKQTAFGSTEFIVIRGKDGITDNDFVYYLTMWPKFRSFAISQMTGTSGRQRVPAKSLSEFKFRLPPLSEQRRIAEVLGSLDDKIELNRRMSETLEAMSQAVFKSWFVDFDPVIDNALAAGNEIPPALQARASRRASGDKLLPPAIRRLFPSEFESSVQGPIPKGWKIKRADDVADIYIGRTPPRKEPQWFSEVRHENEVWVSIRDMAACGVFIGDSSEYLSHEAVRKFNVRMAPKNSVLVSFKLTVGRVAITQTELATNEAIAHFVSPKYGLSSEYLYCYLSAYQYASLASTSSIATAINSKIVKSIPFLVPPGSLARAFHEQVFPYFTKISGLTCQTKSLSGLRDVLLPRLLSGTVSLHESGV